MPRHTYPRKRSPRTAQGVRVNWSDLLKEIRRQHARNHETPGSEQRAGQQEASE